MGGEFTAKVNAHVARSKAAMDAVFKQSVMETIELAQKPVAAGGNMPVDTGFLRNTSFIVGINGQVAGGANASNYVLVIINAQLGDELFAGWTASYARHVEYGARGRSGRFFMKSAALQWRQIVRRNAERARSML